MISEDTVEDPLMSVQFYIKSKVFFIPCYSPSTVSFLLRETVKSVFLPYYDSLKLNNDANYLLIYEDMIGDALMSVQFYIKRKVFSFHVTVHLPHLWR